MSIGLLKNKDFVIITLGKFISSVGSNMQQFALALYIFALTGSATIFASVLALTIVPRLILTPVGGVVADWFDRKKLIVLLDLFNGVIIAIFAIFFYLNKELSLPMIYALVIILEITEVFFNPAIGTVIPNIVNKDDLVEATAITRFTNSLVNILVPIATPIIYGVFGMQLILIVNAISFIGSALSEMIVTIPKTHKKPTKINISAFTKDFNEGLKFIKDSKILKIIISTSALINFAGNALLSIGFIVIIKRFFALSDMYVGILQTVMALTAIFSSIICATFVKKYKPGKLMYLSMTIASLTVILISVVLFMHKTLNGFNSIYAFWTMTFLIIIMWSVIMVSDIGLGSLFQKIVPNEKMGRVGSTMTLTTQIAAPLGQLIFGALFDLIPTYFVILLMGVLIISSPITFRKALLEADEEELEEPNAIGQYSN